MLQIAVAALFIIQTLSQQLPVISEAGASIRVYDMLHQCNQRPLDKTMGIAMDNGQVSALSTLCYSGFGSYVSTFVGSAKNASDVKQVTFENQYIVADDQNVLEFSSKHKKGAVKVPGWPFLNAFQVLRETKQNNQTVIRGIKIMPQDYSNKNRTYLKFGYDIDQIQYVDIWCQPGDYVVEFDLGYNSSMPEKHLGGVFLRCSNEKSGYVYPANFSDLMGDNYKSDTGFKAVEIISEDKYDSVKYITPLASKSDNSNSTEDGIYTVLPKLDSGRLIGISLYYEKGLESPFRRMIFLFEPANSNGNSTTSLRSTGPTPSSSKIF